MNTAGSVERVLGSHRGTVFALCLRVLRHRQDAEDACQEALLKLSRSAPPDLDPERLAAWIHQVALRTAIDHRRANLRRKARELRTAEGAPATDAERTLPVAEALAALPDEDRALLVDHFFARKPLRVLADERGCSTPAVWKRIEKGKDRLRKALLAAAPAAVTAMDGLLEAASAERPPWWTPWRVAVAASVPAVMVAGLAVSGLARREAPANLPRAANVRPAAPLAAAVEVRAPASQAPPTPAPVAAPAAVTPAYPYELPPRRWAEAKRTSWKKLDQGRVALDAEGLLLHDVLTHLTTVTGVQIRLAPDLPVPSTPLFFKAKDLTLSNTLKLLLSPFAFNVDLGADGTVWVRSAKEATLDPDPAFEEVLSVRHGLDAALRAMDDGAKAIPVDPVWADLGSRRIAIPPGSYALTEVVDRLREETGLNTLLALGPAATGDPELERQERELLRRIMELERENRTREAAALQAELRELRRRNRNPAVRPFQGGTRTLEEHLQELSTTWAVGWAPQEGHLLIADREQATEEMARAAQRRDARAAAAARLDEPVVDPFPTTIFQLADALSRTTGLKVVPSENAWAAPLRASGDTWKRVLDRLPDQGFRWLLRDGTVYIDR